MMPSQKAAISTYGRHRQRVITIEDKWAGIGGKGRSTKLFSDSSSGDSLLNSSNDVSSTKPRKPRRAKKQANKNIREITCHDKENVSSEEKSRVPLKALSPYTSNINGSSDSDFFTSQKKWDGVKTFGKKGKAPPERGKLLRLFSTDSNASSSSDFAFTPRSCLKKKPAKTGAAQKSSKKGARKKAAPKKSSQKPSPSYDQGCKYNFSDFDDYSLIISDSPDALVQPGLPSVSPLSSSVSTSTPHHSSVRSARLQAGHGSGAADKRPSLPFSPLPHNISGADVPQLADDILKCKDLVVELSRLHLSHISASTEPVLEHNSSGHHSPESVSSRRGRRHNVTDSRIDATAESNKSGHSSYHTPGSRPCLSGSPSLFSGDGDHSPVHQSLDPVVEISNSVITVEDSNHEDSPCSSLKKRLESFRSNKSLDLSGVILTRQLRKQLLSEGQEEEEHAHEASVSNHESGLKSRLRNHSVQSNGSAWITDEFTESESEELSEEEQEEEEEEEEKLGDILEESEDDQEEEVDSDDVDEECSEEEDASGEVQEEEDQSVASSVTEDEIAEDEDEEFVEHPDDTRYTFADQAQWADSPQAELLSDEEEDSLESGEEENNVSSAHQPDHKSTPVRNQNISLISAAGRLSLREALTPKQDRSSTRLQTPEQQVLKQCGQEKPCSFSQCILPSMMKKCVKIGEGVYGEVFRTSRKGESVALKIIPIEGDFPVNDEPQKKFEEILPEIVISSELSALSAGDTYQTSNFVQVKSVSVVKGCYPAHLLQQWDAFHKRKGSENDRPDMFDDDQLFIVFEFEDSGKDLESFQFHRVEEAISVLHQVTCSLAVAEQALHFEHRDLHWGNVLVKRVPKTTQLQYTLEGETTSFTCHGVKVAIIDFTLSRLSKDGCHICTDLSTDPTLFEGYGDYQFDVYRLMKEENGNSWTAFTPYTNVLWLHYLADKLMKDKTYDQPSPEHKSLSKQLSKFLRSALEYESALNVLHKCELFSSLDESVS